MSVTAPAHPLAAPARAAPPQTSAAAPTIFEQADRIMLATPCYGGNVKQEFMTSLIDSIMHLNAHFRQPDGSECVQPVIADMSFLENESHIDRARNKLANRFLRSPYNWLLFDDADIVHTHADVGRLWVSGMRGARLVCGAYAMKGVVPQFAVAAAAGAVADKDGLIEAVHSGTGFMLIHRSVFEKIEAAGLAPLYNLGSNDPDRALGVLTNRAYFKSGVREMGGAGPLWLSEDYMFCYEYRQLGGKVMVDKNINLQHIGSLKFPAQPVEIAAAMRELRRVGAPGLPVEKI